MATSSKTAYAIPRSAAPRALAPEAAHWWPIPLQATLKHSSGNSTWKSDKNRLSVANRRDVGSVVLGKAGSILESLEDYTAKKA